VDLDTVNSDSVRTGAALPPASFDVIGVLYDKSKLTPAAAVPPGEGVNVRIWGIARVEASAAIAVGAYVASGVDGRVATKVKAIAGAQPGPIVGRALTSGAGAGEKVLVLLMIGAMY
jgi:hypothetical protein